MRKRNLERFTKVQFIGYKLKQYKFKRFAERASSMNREIAVKNRRFVIDEGLRFVIFIPAMDCCFWQLYSLTMYANVEFRICLINESSVQERAYDKLHVRKDKLYRSFYDGAEDGKRYCFIFVEQSGKCSEGFREYLKTRYRECRIVFILNDLAKKRREAMNIGEIKKFSDLIMTYDKGDSEKYGITLYDGPYSKLPVELLDSEVIESDINFVGMAKDRLDSLLKLYDRLTACGIRCDFNIPNLPKEFTIDRPALARGKMEDYIDHLRKVQKTKCVLDITQRGTDGFDVRVWEVVVYGKKIISNNRRLKEAPFYNPKLIFVFDDVAEIDPDWIKADVYDEYKIYDNIMPEEWLKFVIENR